MVDQGKDAWEIVGAGGIGCAVGYALARGGRRVTFVEKDPAKVAWGKQFGTQITGLPPLPTHFEEFRDWSPTPKARILLCIKCYDNREVLERLPPGQRVLSIQNGFDADLEMRNEPAEGIASFVSECFPGRAETRLTRYGSLHVGCRGAQTNEGVSRVQELASALRSAGLFKVRVVDNVQPYKFAKLMYNAAISPLAAAGGLDNGDLLRVPAARRLFFALLQENYGILRHAKKPLGKIGPFSPGVVQRILACSWVARGLGWAFYPTLKGRYCSMSLDLPAGKTEVDNYNGYLLQLAGDYRASLNRLTYSLVKRMEAARTLPAISHLCDLEREYQAEMTRFRTRAA
jgi:2-dehydropantoate 2-reductase